MRECVCVCSVSFLLPIEAQNTNIFQQREDILSAPPNFNVFLRLAFESRSGAGLGSTQVSTRIEVQACVVESRTRVALPVRRSERFNTRSA